MHSKTNLLSPTGLLGATYLYESCLGNGVAHLIANPQLQALCYPNVCHVCDSATQLPMCIVS